MSILDKEYECKRETQTLMENIKSSVISTMRDQIREIAKTPEAVARIEQMLLMAEDQSRQKEIKTTRKPKPVKRFFALWKMRFKYGIHWSKPLYPFRLARNIIIPRLSAMLKSLAGKARFARYRICGNL